MCIAVTERCSQTADSLVVLRVYTSTFIGPWFGFQDSLMKLDPSFNLTRSIFFLFVEATSSLDLNFCLTKTFLESGID